MVKSKVILNRNCLLVGLQLGRLHFVAAAKGEMSDSSLIINISLHGIVVRILNMSMAVYINSSREI